MRKAGSLIEVMRRIYYDFAMRRSTVRILPPQTDHLDLQSPPIFLIGVYRSGTTLLRYIIDSHSNICCPPESDYLASLAQLVREPIYSNGLLNMGYSETHVVQKLRELCIYFYGNYAASCGKPRWADKTPNYVDYLDFIHLLFPEAKFVMIYRHGLDQAHSYTRGGSLMRDTLEDYVVEGEDLRLGAVRYWQEKVQKMLEFEQKNPDICIHIRYEDLCLQPEKHLRAVFSFLDEAWEPEVMEYYNFPHDKGNEDGRVGATTTILPSKTHFLSWPVELRDSGLEIAKPILKQLDY